MKRCGHCGQEKPLKDFAKFANLTWCRECKREYDRSKYDSKAQVARNKANRLKKLAYLLEVQKSGCADCPEVDPVVLEFDHVRGTKVDSVKKMAWENVFMAKLEAEVAKCEVVCANCHRRRTHRRRTVNE